MITGIFHILFSFESLMDKRKKDNHKGSGPVGMNKKRAELFEKKEAVSIFDVWIPVTSKI